jgi:hypothetical protein
LGVPVYSLSGDHDSREPLFSRFILIEGRIIQNIGSVGSAFGLGFGAAFVHLLHGSHHRALLFGLANP